jgi:hypothetical protein
MSAYFLIVSSSGLVDNIIMWDGTIEQWDTSSGFIIQDYYSYTGSFQFTENNERIINGDFINVTTSLDVIPYTGSFTGSFTGSLTGSFNDYSGSLRWLDNFASSSRSGSFTGSFTGSLNGTVSFASTASYVSSIKSGRITIAQWGIETIGGNYTASVSFNSNYDDTSYSVSLTCGADVRALSLTNKQTSGFTVNSNSTSPMTDDVYWLTIPYNNP